MLEKINSKVHIPKNSYLVKKDEEGHSNSDQIIKRTPLTGAKVAANKFVNDVFVYAPRGLQGSRNSNFYQFLSLGMIPNLIGMGTLVALFGAVNKDFNSVDKSFADRGMRRMAASVVLYAAGKWLGSKLMNMGVRAATGVDLDMTYKKVVNEFADSKDDKNVTSVEYHKVFESADFPRWDLINKVGENEGNRHLWYDNIAQRMGFDEKLNSPEQIVQDKVREVIVKSSAAKSISSFAWAAVGVAIAAQKPFESFTFEKGHGPIKFVTQNTQKFATTLSASFLELWNGSGRDFMKVPAKKVGRGLIGIAVGSTVLGVLNVLRGFRVGAKQHETKIDKQKEYEVH